MNYTAFSSWNHFSDLWSDSAVNMATPQNYVEQLWLQYVQYFGEFVAILIFYSFMTTCYIIAGLICLGIDYFRLLDKYKIQPGVLYYFITFDSNFRNMVISLATGCA